VKFIQRIKVLGHTTLRCFFEALSLSVKYLIRTVPIRQVAFISASAKSFQPERSKQGTTLS